MRGLDVLGACTALAILVVASLVFVSRLAAHEEAGERLGVILLLTAIPLGYLLAEAPAHGRPTLYYVQISLMLFYLAVEALLDYVLKLPFRTVRWAAIAYVILFFAGTGGMVGVAARAGRFWAISSGLLFLVMAVLAFVQRARLGM